MSSNAFGSILDQNLSAADKHTLMSMIRCGANRRQVMAWMISAGATIGFAGTLFGAASQAVASAPKKGGRLIIAGAQHGPGDTLDPVLLASGVDFFRARMFYGSLTKLTDTLGYEPELAEEVLSNDDATVWTFKLRKGVEFHDGKPLTADDVIYSMNRHLGKDTVSKASSLVSMVEKWEKVTSHEVRAVLSSPNADLPIALGTYHFKIVKEGTTDFSTAVGTGPYKVKIFSPGVRTVGVRNENFWGEGGYLDEIENFAIPDSTARVTAFLAGDVDGIAALPPKAIEKVENTPGKDIWALKSSKYINIACRTDIQPSGNQDLILAMKSLMDRERMVKGVLKGQGTLGNDQPIGPAYFDHCPDIPQRQLDPDKAKYHFDKSGIGATEIPIVAAEVDPGAVEQCLFLQREAAKIGMNVAVKRVSTDGYWSTTWLTEPFCAVAWGMRPTANIMLSLGYKSDAAWNESYWKSEQFDELLVGVRSVTDANKRKQMYCDMQTMIHDTGGTILPAFSNYVDAVGSHVKGRTYVPVTNFGGAESPQTLWRDDS